jgi:hypothetical protein
LAKPLIPLAQIDHILVFVAAAICDRNPQVGRFPSPTGRGTSRCQS